MNSNINNTPLKFSGKPILLKGEDGKVKYKLEFNATTAAEASKYLQDMFQRDIFAIKKVIHLLFSCNHKRDGIDEVSAWSIVVTALRGNAIGDDGFGEDGALDLIIQSGLLKKCSEMIEFFLEYTRPNEERLTIEM